jgi:hypothetical protein
MRRLALALALVGSTGCGKLFTIKVEGSETITVEQGTLLEQLVGSMGFDSFLDMDLTESSELQNQGVEPGDIQDVRLTEFSLTAVDPAGADLSFLNTMELYVEAPSLPRARVASAGSFPDGEATVAFAIDELDLTDYATSQSMSLTTDVDGHRPDADTDVRADYVLKVGVTGQGVNSGR